jgi:hypothetical protein
MNENSEFKKRTGENRSSEVQMRKALHDIIRLVEGWVDSDASKAAATMLKILNTALRVV